jgi:hypothetical protein
MGQLIDASSVVPGDQPAEQLPRAKKIASRSKPPSLSSRAPPAPGGQRVNACSSATVRESRSGRARSGKRRASAVSARENFREPSMAQGASRCAHRTPRIRPLEVPHGRGHVRPDWEPHPRLHRRRAMPGVPARVRGRCGALSEALHCLGQAGRRPRGRLRPAAISRQGPGPETLVECHLCGHAYNPLTDGGWLVQAETPTPDGRLGKTDSPRADAGSAAVLQFPWLVQGRLVEIPGRTADCSPEQAFSSPLAASPSGCGPRQPWPRSARPALSPTAAARQTVTESTSRGRRRQPRAGSAGSAGSNGSARKHGWSAKVDGFGRQRLEVRSSSHWVECSEAAISHRPGGRAGANCDGSPRRRSVSWTGNPTRSSTSRMAGAIRRQATGARVVLAAPSS